ncbi:MAG: bifunctional UDP-N-acetylmuramoyl-tripeptide:D-alanyl-D-alanine ligase/alanine racemase [Bacteroidales bacterium]|nr:bifunctional UDP-N-acetylmuramoyl-tripeptide:D-alanyl-D-alanine ligase/alanine racemase [Bacteroidales bacterium]
MIYHYHQIAEILNCRIVGNPNGYIRQIFTDSRYPWFEKESLFVALKGNRFDGHQFINELYEAGVKAFIVNRLPENTYNDATYFVVSSTLEALQKLAAWHRLQFHYPVAAITGSYGKSIVKEWIFDLLNQRLNIIRSPKSYNSQLGVPISVLQMSANNELALFEAGISKPKEMSILSSIIKPNIGIITNIGNAHQENFSTLEEKINEKLNLFESVEKIIYPSKYDALDKAIKQRFPNKTLCSWGYHENDWLKIESTTSSDFSTVIQFKIDQKFYTVTLPFSNEAFIENAMTSLLSAYALDANLERLIEQAALLSPIDMRLELVEAGNNCTLINDYYNSDLTSISVALEFLKQQNNRPQKAIILSDIPKTGFSEEEVYKTVAQWINNAHIHFLILIGKEITKYKDFFHSQVITFESVEDFLNHLYQIPFSNTTILLKGARAFAFERIRQKLQLQTHETILKVDLNALLHNYLTYKSVLPPQTKIMAMVKAFSYGSGLFEVARLLQHHNVDYLAVAYADEGFELRQNGIHVPIMVMSPETQTFEMIIEQRLEPVIYSFRTLDLFAKAVSRLGYSEYPCHIKIDTGMHRLGFLPHEINLLTQKIAQYPYIKIKSVFSHLAASEDKAEDEFTKLQIQRLQNTANKLQHVSKDKIWIHILNSAGIERHSQYAFDMVRLGIGLYGISNSGVLKNKLQPVLSFKTIISQIKELGTGETVGYNRKGIITKPSKIAILPVGYADGIDRHLGNGIFKVKIKDKKVPIIGTICMDMCMVDVSDLDVQEGEEVTIFETIDDIETMCHILHTIPYEIFTGISRRVKRIYYHD